MGRQPSIPRITCAVLESSMYREDISPEGALVGVLRHTPWGWSRHPASFARTHTPASGGFSVVSMQKTQRAKTRAGGDFPSYPCKGPRWRWHHERLRKPLVSRPSQASRATSLSSGAHVAASGEIVVMKFGGTSVTGPEDIRRAARRIVAARERGRRVVAVLSARGKTTDQLV